MFAIILLFVIIGIAIWGYYVNWWGLFDISDQTQAPPQQLQAPSQAPPQQPQTPSQAPQPQPQPQAPPQQQPQSQAPDGYSGSPSPGSDIIRTPYLNRGYVSPSGNIIVFTSTTQATYTSPSFIGPQIGQVSNFNTGDVIVLYIDSTYTLTLYLTYNAVNDTLIDGSGTVYSTVYPTLNKTYFASDGSLITFMSETQANYSYRSNNSAGVANVGGFYSVTNIMVNNIQFTYDRTTDSLTGNNLTFS